MTKLVMTKFVMKLGPVITALFVFLFSMLAGQDAKAANGCGAGLYRDAYGRCHFYRGVASGTQTCAVGYIWRNGQCRQNIGNDPFVSTWPNAPR